MAKNKPTPLKDEPVMSLDDISTKLDDLAASIGALQKEPCELVVPKVNIQVKGLHFKTEEEFREKVILLYKGLGIYNQEQEDAYIKELHDKGELSNREMLQAIHKKTCAIPDDNKHVPNSLKDQLIRHWHTIKEHIHIVFYEPSNKWFRNVYAWISIILTLMFTIYEVVNVNRLKAYNEDLRTIAAQHQMTREIVKELDPKLLITLDGYDELVKQHGFASTWRNFLLHRFQLFLLIRFTTTFTITSFSSVLLSAIISVRATRVLSAMRFVWSGLYRIPLLFRNQRKSVAAIRLLPSLNE